LAIAIRTAVIKDYMLYVQAGAGIVADSDPEKEWEETIRCWITGSRVALKQATRPVISRHHNRCTPGRSETGGIIRNSLNRLFRSCSHGSSVLGITKRTQWTHSR
jgi:hypothetical protein